MLYRQKLIGPDIGAAPIYLIFDFRTIFYFIGERIG